jgi:hypothetical protein
MKENLPPSDSTGKRPTLINNIAERINQIVRVHYAGQQSPFWECETCTNKLKHCLQEELQESRA